MVNRSYIKEIIVREMHEAFSCDTMQGQASAFITDKYGVWETIKKLEKELPSENSGSGLERDQPSYRDLFHLKLLVFAQYLLKHPSGIFPCAGIIIGYLAAQNCSPLNKRRLDHVIDTLDATPELCIDNDALNNAMLEAYHCAGRMVPFESRLSHRLHGAADQCLASIMNRNPHDYVEFLAVAANAAADAADRYIAGTSLLVMNFETVIRDLFEDLEVGAAGEDTTETREYIITTSYTGASLSASLAYDLIEHSPLLDVALKHFSGFWDVLYACNPEQAHDLLAFYDAEEPDIVPANQKITLALKQKYRIIEAAPPKPGAMTYEISLKPDSRGLRARQRLMTSSAMNLAQPLARPT